MSEPSILLHAQNLSVRFDGNRVVDSVSFTLRKGEALAIIGGNGSGKTTILNALSGTVASTGRIILLGKDVQGLQPWVRVRIGLVRTLQTARGFTRLSSTENLALAKWAGDRKPFGSWVMRLGDAASSLLLGSLDLAPSMAEGLATAQETQIARALQASEKIALLDEPFAGFRRRRIDLLKAKMRSYKGAGGALVIVEHHIGHALDVVEHVLELENGRMVFYGDSQTFLKRRRELCR